MRKVYIDLKVQLILKVNDNQSISEIIENLECNIVDGTNSTDIEDVNIDDYEITDSK